MFIILYYDVNIACKIGWSLPMFLLIQDIFYFGVLLKLVLSIHSLVVVISMASVAAILFIIIVFKRRYNVTTKLSVPVPETECDPKVSYLYCDAMITIMAYYWYRIKPHTVGTVGIQKERILPKM